MTTKRKPKPDPCVDLTDLLRVTLANTALVYAAAFDGDRDLFIRHAAATHRSLVLFLETHYLAEWEAAVIEASQMIEQEKGR